MKYLLALLIAISAACFSTNETYECLEAKLVKYKIKELQEDLEFIALHHSDKFTDEPKYLLDEPQYNYFFKWGQIWAYHDCLRILEAN